jgi:hypothetical protein
MIISIGVFKVEEWEETGEQDTDHAERILRDKVDCSLGLQVSINTSIMLYKYLSYNFLCNTDFFPPLFGYMVCL